METKIVNTAQETAISVAVENIPDRQAIETRMRYHIILALIDGLVESGDFSQADKRMAYDLINRKYGLSSNSIFAETA